MAVFYFFVAVAETQNDAFRHTKKCVFEACVSIFYSVYMIRLCNTSYPCLFNHVFCFLKQVFPSPLQSQHKVSEI